jgi:sugar phosphate permease
MSATASTATASPPTAAASNRWLVLVIACLAQFMVVLDATVVNVALPSIQRGLHFSAANLQWVVNAYTLVFGGFLLLGGRASDLLGRKRLFIAGTVLFSAASLLNGLAQSSTMLVAGRGLQGLGGRFSPLRRWRSSPPPSPRPPSEPRRWACGARSRPAAARPVCCSAAC